MAPIGYEAYNHVLIQTTSKERILLLLFEALIECVQKARLGLLETRVAMKGENISKAIAILSELVCALDHEVGGELAERLAGLYGYLIRRLTEANIHNAVVALDEVERLLIIVQEGFEEASSHHKVPVSQATPESEGIAGRSIDFAV